ncbi:MAG: FimV/HubP family polar landmark protein [Steroidobacteraceae bacterium]
MRLRVVSTAASLLAVAPGVSFALGLGDIQLRSTLNAPLNADIELIGTPEELANLASLRTQLASRDSFSRYGLEYPSFLSSIQVRPERLADGRTIIRLTSSIPMTEPFATLLVEYSVDRSRGFREYTVLFDPPAFATAPTAAAPAPVAAPIAGAGDRSAPIARPPAQPAATPAAVSTPRPAPVNPPTNAAAGEYTVRSGDSLSGIVKRQYGAGEAERAMIAIYRGNQNAFDGNINRLRAGTVLRLPDNTALAAVDSREASAEVRRQMASWRTDAGVAPADADPRLRLIPPASPGAGVAPSGETKALRDRVASLETELAESRRLLDLRNAELARAQGAAAPAPTAPAAPAEQPAVAPVTPEPAPAVVQPVAEQPAKPAPPPVVEDTGPSLLDRLKEFWFVPAGLLAALLLAVLGVRAARRRRETSVDSLAPFDLAAATPVRDTSSDTFPLRRPLTEADDPSILVEESGTHERPVQSRRETRTVDLEDSSPSMAVPTLDATMALEQGDPLAEADFHMAYGLYDQAADLVKLAILREPGRRDLKLKLLEVFFVWGNKDQFLQTARELADTRDASAPGEWEKVVIMGKQLAPEDTLFSQSYSGGGPATVDLNLEGGQNLVDFDLHGEPSATLNDLSGSGLDFTLDDPTRGDLLARTATTRQMAQPGLAGLDDGPPKRHDEGPTVEQPTLGGVGDTLVGKIDAHMNFSGAEQTAELAIDDLGLDLGKFDATGTHNNLLDDSQLARALEAADAPTLVAGMDETSRQMVQEASDLNQPTELLPLGNFAAAGDDEGATARLQSLDLEFSIDPNAETGKRAVLGEGDFNLDLDVGSAEKPGDGEFQRTQRLDSLPSPEADPTERDLEPITMSEVGTKLDLARAYMDMGDPDGARSILREVLQEGSANQRQEAQRLIDSIPG